MDESNKTMRLEVFVSEGCFGCDTALNVAQSIRDSLIPGLQVDVIDLTQPESERPSNVFATPTYRLNGRVISLGNPDKVEIVEQLREMGSASEQANTSEKS